MRRTPLALGIASLLVAALIFLFGQGLRVLYSGGFFLMLGIGLLLDAKRGTGDDKS